MKLNVSWGGGQGKKTMSSQFFIKRLTKLGSFIDAYGIQKSEFKKMEL